MRVGERYGTKIWSGGDWGKVDGRLFGFSWFSSGRVWDLWLLYDRDPMRTLTLRIIIIIMIIIVVMMMMMMMIISSQR